MSVLCAARIRAMVIVLLPLVVGCGGYHHWVGRYVDRSAALHAQ